MENDTKYIQRMMLNILVLGEKKVFDITKRILPINFRKKLMELYFKALKEMDKV